MPEVPRSLVMEGSKLLPAEAGELELQLSEDPTLVENRIKLIAFYFCGKHRENRFHPERVDHILWIIKNCPGHPILSHPPGQFLWHEERVEDAKQLLMEQIELNPNNVEIIANAARFLAFEMPNESEELYQRLKSILPNCPTWGSELLFRYSLNFPTTEGPDLDSVKQKAIREAESLSQITAMNDALRNKLLTALESLKKSNTVDRARRSLKTLYDTSFLIRFSPEHTYEREHFNQCSNQT